MKLRDDFSAYYAELLDGTYECLDRIVLNAYFTLGITGGGMRTWWRHLHGSDANLSDGALRDMAGTFARRLRAYCAKHQIPFLETKAGERKHQLAENHLPKDPAFKGLFLVLTAKAPAPVWQVHRNAAGQIAQISRPDQWPHVKHYYFHIIDPRWGHLTIRMSGHPPFGAQIILNGHEWVERSAQHHHWTVTKEANCFVDGSDFERLHALTTALQQPQLHARLQDVCRRWIDSSCLCFALTLEEQKRSRFEYTFSCFQLELSRNFLFHRPADLDEVYQKLLDRTRQSLDVKQLKTIFGFTHRPHLTSKRRRTWPEISKELKTPHYDLTVFKVRWGSVLLKIYDKGQRVLRVEVTGQHAGQLGCGKLLPNLPAILKRMRQILVDFLAAVQAAHVSFLDRSAFEPWTQPTQRGARRLAGIDLNKARNRFVVDAVLGLATQPDGFTIGQLAQAVRERTGWTLKHYPPRKAAYDLAKLQGKKLVLKVPPSHRYRCESPGIRVMCGYLILRENVIKPLLAGILRPNGRPPKNIHPIHLHYVNLRVELNETLRTIGFAA
jgi:hypothetical protein